MYLMGEAELNLQSEVNLTARIARKWRATNNDEVY